MQKILMPLEMSTTEEGDIRIEQSRGSGEIVISPDSVPILKQWLDEAVEEIIAKEKSKTVTELTSK